MPQITQHAAEWFIGYDDGLAGRPAEIGASLSYLSGWIEGAAALRDRAVHPDAPHAHRERE